MDPILGATTDHNHLSQTRINTLKDQFVWMSFKFNYSIKTFQLFKSNKYVCQNWEKTLMYAEVTQFYSGKNTNVH